MSEQQRVETEEDHCDFDHLTEAERDEIWEAMEETRRAESKKLAEELEEIRKKMVLQREKDRLERERAEEMGEIIYHVY